jgi:hypothetical protein
MLFRTDTRRLLARFLFGFFALLLLNGIVFRHGHRLPDGRIISHAHPFWPDGQGPIKSNTHSAGELFLFDALSNASFTPTEVVTFGFVAAVVGYLVCFFFVESPLRAVLIRFVALRGPPVESLNRSGQLVRAEPRRDVR